jgi:threonine/homoserine/homoserine lactone efflux protein
MGLLVTLGNPKPILFYSALLPTFLDVTAIGIGDFLLLGAVVVVVSFTVYGGYMVLAERSRRMLASTAMVRRLNQATGAVLVGSGLVVASR